jgi:hypothetical protein
MGTWEVWDGDELYCYAYCADEASFYMEAGFTVRRIDQ